MSDPRLSDDVARANRAQSRGNTGLIGGIIAVAMVVVIAGLRWAANNKNTAANQPSKAQTTTGAASSPTGTQPGSNTGSTTAPSTAPKTGGAPNR